MQALPNSPVVDFAAIAPRSALLFSALANMPENITPSGHKVKKMVITEGPEAGMHVWVKLCNETDFSPLMAQVEAAASASYRVVRLKTFARIRPVIDAQGRVTGTASYDIAHFKPFQHTLLKVKACIEGFADESVSRYQREEDDAHAGNYGYSPELGIVGIDPGMSFYSRTYKLQGARFISGKLAPSPEQAFPQTKEDITDRFPDIQDAQPCHWPTKSPNNYNVQKSPSKLAIDEFKKLRTKKAFLDRKNFAFLKEMVIDTAIHFKLLENNFTHDQEARDLLKDLNLLFDKRRLKSEEILIADQAFRQFLLDSNNALQNCLQHFIKYNETVGIEENIQFDLESIKHYLEIVLKKCLIKDLTFYFFEIGSFIERIANTEHFKSTYQKLVGCTAQFKDSQDDLLTAISQLVDRMRAIIGNVDSKAEEEQWNFLLAGIEDLIERYKKSTARLSQKNPFHCQQTPMVEITDLKKSEEYLAMAVVKWLSQPEHKQQVLHFAEETLQGYQPLGHGTMWGAINPKTYTKTRVTALEELITKLKDETIRLPLELTTHFFESGNWNEGWSPLAFADIISPSANVVLINKICAAAIRQLSENLSIEQLADVKMIEACSVIDLQQLHPLLIGQKILQIVNVKPQSPMINRASSSNSDVKSSIVS